MRGAIWLVLLLLAPLSSGMLSPLNLTPDFITPEESEFVLTRDTVCGVQTIGMRSLSKGFNPCDPFLQRSFWCGPTRRSSCSKAGQWRPQNTLRYEHLKVGREEVRPIASCWSHGFPLLPSVTS